MRWASAACCMLWVPSRVVYMHNVFDTGDYVTTIWGRSTAGAFWLLECGV
jgi:hypothetical protein